MEMKLEDVKKLSQLARIDMPESEAKELLEDMSSILNYVGEIKKASAEEIIPEAGKLRNVFREDREPHNSGEYTREILTLAPKTEKEYVKVKQILS